MFIMDYEDAVTVVAANGRRHAAVLKGLVEPDSPATAGLGHSLLGLADQTWRELTLRASEALDFPVGQLVFRDGSRCDVQLMPNGRDPVSAPGPSGTQYVYMVALLRPGR